MREIYSRMSLTVTLVAALNLSGLAHAAQMDPLGLILSWTDDPRTTMVVDWHTKAADANATVQYRRAYSNEDWRSATGQVTDFPHSERKINRVHITGLVADSEYHYRVGEFERVRKFRTMPDNSIDRPVRFASGGDVRHNIQFTNRVNRHIAQYDPDFIVWGGDIAYADGRDDRAYRWYEVLDSVMHTLVTPAGRDIPVIIGIGNHEVLGGYHDRNDHERRTHLPPYTQTDVSRSGIAPYYFALAAFPGQPGYGALDFGDYLSIVLLDTNHANPIEGEQTRWLEQALRERSDVPHVFPVYHVGAFPSVRSPSGSTHTAVRELWVPLFEQHNVKVAFENHDHIYKRTYPIRDGKVSNNGVVYIGDGSWGTNTREIGRSHEEHAWYLKRAAEVRHAIIATLHGPHQHFLVVNEHGHMIDEYPRTTHLDLIQRDMALDWSAERPTDN